MKPDKTETILWYLDKIEKSLAINHSPASNIMNVIRHIQSEIKENFISKEQTKELINKINPLLLSAMESIDNQEKTAKNIRKRLKQHLKDIK